MESTAVRWKKMVLHSIVKLNGISTQNGPISSRHSKLDYVVLVHLGHRLDGSAKLSVNLSKGEAGANVSRWKNQGW